jgi:hypothetical protein
LLNCGSRGHVAERLPDVVGDIVRRPSENFSLCIEPTEPDKNVLIVQSLGTKLINGSPFNSISVVPPGLTLGFD